MTMIGHKSQHIIIHIPFTTVNWRCNSLVFTDDCLDGAAEEVVIVVVELLVVH